MAAGPSGLSYTQREPPTADQLINRERDPLAALFAFAMNSGQHRFREIIDLAAANAVDPAAESRFSDLLDAEFPSTTRGDVYERFTQRWNIEAPLLACAVCGVRQVVNDPSTSGTKQLDQLIVLRYTAEQKATLHDLPEAYRPAVSHYQYDGHYYHVHQNLVHFPAGTDKPHVEICLTCWKAVQYDRIPKFAVANGVDFGSASRLQLPTLHLVEQYLIARSIVFISLVKLNAAALAEAQTGKRGHVITFPHHGPAGLAEHTSVNIPPVFPNLNAVYTNVLVCFVGARPAYDALVPDRPGRITELQVRKEVVYKWLKALKALHPLYEDIVIDESETMGQSLDDITPTLWRNSEELTDQAVLNIEQFIEAERLSHRPQGLDEELATTESTDATEPEWPPLPSVMVTKTPHVNPATLPPITSVCAAVERALQAATQPSLAPEAPIVADVEFPVDGHPVQLDVSASEPPANVRPLLIKRANTPLNEFTENDRLFYSAFPFVFLLGRGLQQVGSVPKAARRHLLLQYTNAAASCARLVHLLFDQLQRHAATVQTAVYVKANPGSFDAFAAWQADETFLAQLREAAQHPNRPASKALAKRILNVVAVVAPRIPFTTAARKSAMPKLLALTYFFDLPSIFLTFAPDDAHGTLNLRLSLPSSSNQSFPATDDGFLDDLRLGRTTSHAIPIHGKALLALLVSGPVAAAEIFRLLVDAVFIDILGLPPVTGTRQTPSLLDRQPGLLGTPLAAFGCVEEQARGSPHIHIVYWGGLPPELLQAIATTPVLVDLVARKLDGVFSGTAEPLAHLKSVLRRRLRAPFERPALYRAHHPLHQPELFQQDVDRTATSVHLHDHSRTCHKPPAGREVCRLGRPAPLLEATGAVQIVSHKTDEGRTGYRILEDIQPAARRTPPTLLDRLRPDPRLIIYELRRPRLHLQSTGDDNPEERHWTIVCGDTPHPVPADCAEILNGLTPAELLRLQQELSGRNGLVVEHNPLMATMLACNTNVSLLGSAAQAKAILCYLLLYVTKGTNELAESVALLHNARLRTERFPSIAEDRDSSQRKGRLFLHKLLNDISGRVEVSGTMAALCLLGGEAEVFSHQFFYCFVTAAIQYAKQAHLPQSEFTLPPEEAEETEEHSASDDLDDHFDFNVPLEMPITIAEAPAPTLNDTSAPLYRSGNRHKPVHQHIHYALRGPALRHLCLFEYAGLINVTPMTRSVTIPDDEAPEPFHTRLSNGTFRFAPTHPLYDTHHQQLRSLTKVPIPVSRPPAPPPDDVDQNTAAWRRQAQTFAEYFLVLLRPWSADDGTHPGPLSWQDFTAFLTDLLEGSNHLGPSCTDSKRLRWLRNMAAGLRIPSADRTAVQKFRCRNATRWASQSDEGGLEPPVEQRYHLAEGEDLTAAEEAIEFWRDQAHVDDRESAAAIEEALYEEATLQHLADAAENLPRPSVPPTRPAYRRMLFHLKASDGVRVRAALTAPPPPLPPPSLPESNVDSPTSPTDSPVVPPAEIESSIVQGLNAEQRAVFDRCADYFRRHKRETQSGLSPPEPFRILVHGGPGTGKTYLSNAIVQAAERAGYAVSCIAPTGIAAANLPAGRTVHNFLGVGLLKAHETHKFLDPPSDAKVAQFHLEHDADRLRLLVIDEISFLLPSLFGQLEKQLQSLILGGTDRSFGGLAVLITGDFFQLPPVGASHALYEPFTSYPKDEAAGQHAATLFADFQIVDLHQQMRAAEDPAHGVMLDRLRWPVAGQSRIDVNYIQSLRELSPDDVRQDPTWATAPVIVSSNHMRRAVNDAVSRNFARLHGQHRYIWRTPLTGNYASFLNAANLEYLYPRYPGLTSFFISGAPALLTSNINPGLGLANGTAVVMHSLCLDDREDEQRIDQLSADPEPVDILLNFPPKYIAVRVPRPTDALKRVPDGSLCPEEGCIVAVHPILSRKPVLHSVSLGGRKFDLKALPHALDPAFSLTVHKIQGQTCDKLIIDLNKTPIRPKLNFQGLVVLLSRVRSSTNLRLLPSPTLQSDYRHLLKLNAPIKLTSWLQRLQPSVSTRTAAPTGPASATAATTASAFAPTAAPESSTATSSTGSTQRTTRTNPEKGKAWKKQRLDTPEDGN